ncbi:MAG: hypothetical protein C3F11_11380 [Methylocystaceae bacterium]|nr:MAG: hypothetical protein C3F11_11380 [Methylocystaceae bacterium]
MDVKSFQEILAAFKNLLATLGLVLAIGFLVLNAEAIGDGFVALIDRFGRLRGAEIAGVKLDFGEAAIERQVPDELFRHLDSKDKRRIAQDVGKLEPRLVVRLLHVGLLANLCEFEKPTTGMIDDFGADHHLQDMGLVTLTDNPQTKTQVLADIKQREAAARKKSDIGDPRACYDLTLTDHGRDVKTAVVQVVSASFGGASPEPDASLAEKRSQSKRR